MRSAASAGTFRPDRGHRMAFGRMTMSNDVLTAKTIQISGGDNRNAGTVDCKRQSAYARMEQDAAGASADKVPAKAGGKRKRLAVLAAILLAGATAGGWYGWHWYAVGRYLVET